MRDFTNLLAIGFTTDGLGRLVFPDGRVTSAFLMNRLDHMNGRMSNVNYMAKAIDALLDGVLETEVGRASSGSQQFHHLVKVDRVVALIYVALRRRQRDGQVAKLRQGLTVLLAYDHQEMGGEDAIDMVWDAAWSRPRALAAPATAIAA